MNNRPRRLVKSERELGNCALTFYLLGVLLNSCSSHPFQASASLGVGLLEPSGINGETALGTNVLLLYLLDGENPLDSALRDLWLLPKDGYPIVVLSLANLSKPDSADSTKQTDINDRPSMTLDLAPRVLSGGAGALETVRQPMPQKLPQKSIYQPYSARDQA